MENGGKKKYGVFCRKKSPIAEGKNNILYVEKLDTDGGNVECRIIGPDGE